MQGLELIALSKPLRRTKPVGSGPEVQRTSEAGMQGSELIASEIPRSRVGMQGFELMAMITKLLRTGRCENKALPD